MSTTTSIEWTEATWNPTTGCTKVSPGCAHCYIERTPAFRMAGRTFKRGVIPVQLHRDRLNQPGRWKRPRRVFVNSLSDLFHDDVPDQFLHDVYHVMEHERQHTFQILTKRPERMCAYLNWRYGGGRIPSRHIWHGVSAENQHFADQRIGLLLATRSAVRFVSAEPLLEDIDLTPHLYGATLAAPGPSGFRPGPRLDWVIVGGESGPRARPMKPDWVVSVRDQCRAASVPFFFKQWGGVRKALTGRTLQGRTYDEFPKIARTRAPAVRQLTIELQPVSQFA